MAERGDEMMTEKRTYEHCANSKFENICNPRAIELYYMLNVIPAYKEIPSGW